MSRHFELEGPNRGLRLRFVDVQETRGGGYSGFQEKGMSEWEPYLNQAT